MLALGLLLLFDILWKGDYFVSGLNFWPLIIIGLGIELLVNWLLIRKKSLQERIRLDGRSLALLFLVGVFSVNFYLSTNRTAQGEEPQPPQKPLLTVTNKDLALPTQVVPLPEQVQQVVIENPLGSIEVAGSTHNSQMQIHAEAHVSFIEKTSPVTAAVGLMPRTDVGQVTTVRVQEPTGENGSGSIDLKIEVPPGKKLAVHTQAGDIKVIGYTGDTDIWTRSGSVTVDRLNGDLKADVLNGALSVRDQFGTANLYSGQGNIKATKIGGDLIVKSDAGDCEIAEVTGRLDLTVKLGKVNIDTVSGDIAAVADSAVFNVRNPEAKLETTLRGIGDITVRGEVLAPWTINTENGKTTLEIPKESSIKFLGETNKGVVKGPTKSSKNAGTRQGTLLTDKLGEGKWPVTVRAYSGSIYVDLY
jgi:DUF4097 and DUF4098 domain-containing protein YvlB